MLMDVARIHPVNGRIVGSPRGSIRKNCEPDEYRRYRHEKLLKAPLDNGGGDEVGSREIGVSAGPSSGGFGDASCDEVVIGGGSS